MTLEALKRLLPDHSVGDQLGDRGTVIANRPARKAGRTRPLQKFDANGLQVLTPGESS